MKLLKCFIVIGFIGLGFVGCKKQGLKEQDFLLDCSTPSPICTDEASCAVFCGDGKPPPICASGAADPSKMVPVSMLVGIDNTTGEKVDRSLIEPLRKAGEIAYEHGFVIRIRDGYRSIHEQIQVACNAIRAGNGEKLGHQIALPGNSNHGLGRSVDVQLFSRNGQRSGQEETYVGDEADNDRKYSNLKYSPILLDFMTKAGFVRLKNEIWHFEYGTNLPDRCNSIETCR